MGSPSKVVAPTFRSSYGVLAVTGAVVLAVGILLPYLVADPAKPTASGERAGRGSRLVDTPRVISTDDLIDEPVAPGTTAGPVAAATPVGAVPAAPGANTASDVGLTADAIKLGILIPDGSSLGEPSEDGPSFGELVGDPGEQWKVFVDELNARGGIAGRRIDPVYRKHDLLDADNMRAACVYLTEEVKVFAVLSAGGYFGDPILCFSEQHRTPIIAQAGEADDFYQRSKGYYFSTTPSKDRVLKNMVAMLDRDGTIKGKKIGLLDGEGIDAIPVDRTLLPALKQFGYTLTHHSRIAADLSAAQAQIPLEIQQMRSKGVEIVLPVTNLLIATVFAQEADSQRYTPSYVLSDFASGATDLYSTAMPASFEGSIAYTALRTGEAAAGLPEAPQDAACGEIFRKRAGRALNRTSTEYYSAVTACGVLDMFARGVVAAGSGLTRASFVAGMQTVGEFPVPYSGPGSFRQGKFDAPDAARRVTWRFDCHCWRPIDKFQRTPF